MLLFPSELSNLLNAGEVTVKRSKSVTVGNAYKVTTIEPLASDPRCVVESGALSFGGEELKVVVMKDEPTTLKSGKPAHLYTLADSRGVTREQIKALRLAPEPVPDAADDWKMIWPDCIVCEDYNRCFSQKVTFCVKDREDEKEYGGGE